MGADSAMKEQLMQLHMVAAKEFDVGGRNAIVISVPAPQVAAWRKVQEKLVRELEKKFSNKHVHENVLEDIVYPSTIIGKRIRHKTDGKSFIKAFLNRSTQGDTEHKIATFSAVYKRLTGKNVLFEFPEYELDAELKSSKK